MFADALRNRLEREHHPVLAIAVGAVHAHLLVQLPDAVLECKRALGLAKRFATEQIKHALTGKLWAQGGTFKPTVDASHQRQTFHYITAKQRPAWVWDFKSGGRYLA